MSVAEKKKQLLAELQEVRQQILAAARGIPAENVDTVFLGTWGVKELLAHLAGWDVTNQEAVDDILRDQVPRFYAQYDRDWATYNARLVAEYKRENLDELLGLVEDTHQELLEKLNELTAEEWFRDRGLRSRGYKVLIGRLIAAELTDELEHLAQILSFVDDCSGDSQAEPVGVA